MKKSAPARLWRHGRIAVRAVKRALLRFVDEDNSVQAAAIAYYSVFSLPAMLLILIRLVGFWLGDERVRDSVIAWIAFRIGPQAAELLRELILTETGRVSVANIAAAVGLATLLFSATTVFAQVQSSLNRVWGVAPRPELSILRGFAIKRLIAFVILLGAGVVLFLSMTAGATLAAVGRFLGDGALTSGGLTIANIALSTAVAAALFAGIFRSVPATDVAWQDAWAGGLFTAVIFAAGNRLVAVYFHFIPVGGVYGSAGSLAVILFWFYFAAATLLLGAQFTQIYAQQRGRATQRPADK